MKHRLTRLSPFLLLAPLLLSDDSSPAPIRSDSLSRSTLLPEGVTSFGAVVHENWLYVYGGHTGRTHDYSVETVSGDFRRLNLIDRSSWEELPDGPPLQGVSLVAHGAYIYRAGGLSIRNSRGEPKDLRSVASVERYDPTLRKWEALTPLPEATSSHDAAVLGEELYVFGGWTLSSQEEKKWHTTGFKAHLGDGKLVWEPLTDLPFTARAMAVVACGGKLHVLGGMNEEGEQLRGLQVYDPSRRLWSRGPDLPVDGFGVTAAAIGESIFAAGGDGRILRLTAGGQWMPVQPLAFPRIFARMLPVSSGELLVVGGTCTSAKARAIEYVRLDAREPDVLRFSMPYPGAAKSRQGVIFESGTLELFGGNRSLEQHDFGPDDFVNEAFSLNLGALRVSPVRPFPKKVQSIMATCVPGVSAGAVESFGAKSPRRFAVGGFGHDGQVARSQAEIFEWNAEALEWRRMPVELPRPRTQGALVSWGGSLWLLGGMDYDPRRDGNAFQYELEVLQWDLSSSGSSFASSGQTLPRPRRAFAWVMLEDKLYLLGGLGEKFARIEECDVFDFKERRWETIPSPRASRISPESATLGGKIYLAGGLSRKDPASPRSFEPNSSIEVYDPQIRQWRTEAWALPLPAEHVRMAAWNESLLFWSTYSVSSSALELAIVKPRLASPAEPRAGD